MNQSPASSKSVCRSVTSRAQKGVGLLEVLIAVLVLSIGILGLAALQTRALSNNGNSMGQSMATLASYSILDAMRADQTNALAGLYNGSVTASNCPAVGTTLAQYQLNNWCTQLGTYLGATASTIGTINCSSANICTIKIQFNDSKGAGTGDVSNQQIITQAGL